MDMTPKEYQQYVKKKSPKSPIVKDTILAFVIGGIICVIGQAIMNPASSTPIAPEAAEEDKKKGCTAALFAYYVEKR